MPFTASSSNAASRTMFSPKGFSLRQSLEDQGVTTEEAMRGHLSYVHSMLGSIARIDRYRVNATNPNNFPTA